MELYFILKIKVKQIRFLGFRGITRKTTKYLLVYEPDPKLGMVAYMFSIVKQCKWAEEKGYIPIVDMQNFVNGIDYKRSSINSWELYFEQPMDVNLAYAKSEMSVRYINRNERNEAEKTEITRKDLDRYVRLKKELSNEIQDYYDKNIESKNIFGVVARGTDYRNPANGLPSANIEELISVCASYLEKGGYEYIFFTTEDANYFEKFIASFGEKIIYMDDERTSMDMEIQFLCDQWKNLKLDLVKKNAIYLETIYLLSKMRIIVSNCCCGSVTFAEKYNENNELFECNILVDYLRG